MYRLEWERVDGKEGRRWDLEQFWPGFVEICSNSPQTVARCLGEFKAYGDRAVSCTESLLLFLYGARLTKEMRPWITARIEVPKVEPVANFQSFSHWRDRDVLNGRLGRTWFGVNYDFLTNPSRCSSLVAAWSHETTRSVSKCLPDWLVVDLVVAGAEEYAHELYCRYKQGRHLRAVKPESVEADNVLYHSTDHERRGLTWRLALLERYFPHWSGPARELKSRVKQARQQKNDPKIGYDLGV